MIRHWASRHDVIPAEIRPRKFDGEPAVLTFLVGEPDMNQPEIYPISWESFFAQFDLMGLSVAFDEKTARFDIVRVEKGSEARLAH